MPELSPLAHAEARILALEAEVDRLRAKLTGTVYDGTPGTLPPKGLHLVSLADECGWLIRQGSRDNWKTRIGDTWWPLPGGGE